MKKFRLFILYTVAVMSVVLLTACGNKEFKITSFEANTEKNYLSAEYTTGEEIAEGDFKYIITITQNTEQIKGTLYREYTVSDKREKSTNYNQLIMLNGTSKWTTDGEFTYDGETGTGEVMVVDILSEFGPGTVIKIIFYNKDEEIASESLTLK